MTDIDDLRRDHKHVQALVAKLVSASSAAAEERAIMALYDYADNRGLRPEGRGNAAALALTDIRVRSA